LDSAARIGVVGATGAVGRVTLELLRERGYGNVRAFASARTAGKPLGELVVEEATPEALSAGDLDLCLFSVGTAASRELVPHAVRGSAVVVDKSSAYRLEADVPLVVRVSTYQSASGAGSQRMEELRSTPPGEANLGMDWDFDGDEFDEETKLREETRKILELPELPISATCVRVPVLIGHAEAVWVETERSLSAAEARTILADAPGIRVHEFPTPRDAAETDDVLVGRIRRDPTVENGLVLFVVADNLRKGAALNAIQIAELLPVHKAVPA
jgi:aspartate-semialdehyde dehydrogenase